MYFKITRLFAALPSLLAVLKIELYELYFIFLTFHLVLSPVVSAFVGDQRIS